MSLSSLSKRRLVIEQRFHIGDLIADEPNSTTYRVTDQVTGKSGVIKFFQVPQSLKPLREWIASVANEIKTLKHPNIASCSKTGWLPKEHAFYLIRSYFPRALDTTKVSLDDLPRLIREFSVALAYLHEQNIAHGNIIPANLFLNGQGRGCLTDPGVVQLRKDLRIGTLNSSMQLNFLAPELRKEKEFSPTLEADVYALGRIFDLLIRENASWDSSEALISLKDHVSSMLDSEPEKRIRITVLAERLEEGLVGIPGHYLFLPPSVCDKIGEVIDKHSGNVNWTQSDVIEYVTKDLGEDTGFEVGLETRRGREGDTLLDLYGHTHRYRCRPDRYNKNILAAIDFHSEGGLNKFGNKLYPSKWIPIRDYPSLREDDAPLQQLFNELKLTDQIQPEISKDVERTNTDTIIHKADQSRQTFKSVEEFAETWLGELDNQKKTLGLEYVKFARQLTRDKQEILRFHTSETTNELDWESDEELWWWTDSDYKYGFVGKFVEVQQNSIIVRIDTSTRQENKFTVPPSSGRLVPKLRAELNMLTVQEEATEKLLNHQVHNPLLSKVISGQKEAQYNALDELHYCQSYLSDDQRQAVQQALAALQLFLIKGPPGTGKTAVIAELALQILKQDPDAKILVTSQSNIAVDNVLSRIEESTKEAGWQQPVMIRYLSEAAEKKSKESTEPQYTKEYQAEAWRRMCLSKLKNIIERLKQSECDVTFDMKIVKALESDSTSLQLKKWRKKAESLVKQAEDCQVAYETLQHSITDLKSPAALQASTLLQFTVADIHVKIRECLNELPGLIQLSQSPEASADSHILNRLVEIARKPETLESQVQERKHQQETRNILESWQRGVGKEDFLDYFENQAQVIGATCIKSGNTRDVPHAGFSWVIVDEAGRATLPETLVPLIKGARCVLVGDERQLPPTIKYEQDQELSKSLFEYLIKTKPSTHVTSLDRQRRMHPAIGRMISDVFYDGELKQGKKESQFEKYGWLYTSYPPVVWINSANHPKGREQRRKTSYINEGEFQIVKQCLERLNSYAPKQNKPSVGIISGYKTQTDLLRNRFKQLFNSLNVEINTVDAFQGRECDVIIYSVVRSNSNRKIGFLRDKRRLNVALSRARAQLLIVGDVDMMEAPSNTENPFRDVLTYIRKHPEDNSECRIVDYDKYIKTP